MEPSLFDEPAGGSPPGLCRALGENRKREENRRQGGDK